METPIYDFLTEYAKKNPLRMHMPGHKGYVPENISHSNDLKDLYSLDITEIHGADSLFEADGIIKKSEENASRLYNSAETVYSCGGSTLCIQAMLCLMKHENRHIIAGRTVHKAFLNACILLGLSITWVYPKEENGILSGKYDVLDFEKALADADGKPCCVYITSPDYMGNMADIRSLSEISHKYDAPLLVDNAHGAHLAFTLDNLHPIALGADLCCDSAHKMLPCITGCAYLHTSNERYKGRLKSAMNMFGSTSPSYLMLMSLDLCNRFLAENAKENIAEIYKAAINMKKRLSEKYNYIFGSGQDVLHIVIDTAKMGIDGYDLAEKLESLNCYPEYVGNDAVILLLSASQKAEEILNLEKILEKCMPISKIKHIKHAEKNPPSFPKPNAVMDIRSAALSQNEVIKIENAVGRICADVKVPCPPAIPIVISGELIDEKAVEILKFYKIKEISVISANIYPHKQTVTK